MNTPKHLVHPSLTDWSFSTHYDFENSEWTFTAKSPNVSKLFEVKASRHLSEKELIASVTVEECLNWEKYYLAEQLWSHHQYAIRDAMRKAIREGAQKITIDLDYS